MHVEFKNVTTGKYYYLLGTVDDLHGGSWTPDIIKHLYVVDPKQTVGELFDLVGPVMDRLIGDTYDKWEVTIFRLTGEGAYSLTTPADIIARYEVGDIRIINGVRQPTLFHPK